jgi:hypothetical protein
MWLKERKTVCQTLPNEFAMAKESTESSDKSRILCAEKGSHENSDGKYGFSCNTQAIPESTEPTIFPSKAQYHPTVSAKFS